MAVHIIVRDRNFTFIEELKQAASQFQGLDPETVQLTLEHGDIFESFDFDAIVSPANSFGFMNGGIDLVYRDQFGVQIEDRVRRAISSLYRGELLVGQAFVIDTMYRPSPTSNSPKLIVAPTMRVPQRIADYTDVYLATRAAMLVAAEHGLCGMLPLSKANKILFPGMGTATGGVPYRIAARNMLLGFADGLKQPKQYLSCAQAFLDSQKYITI
jgi:O-acetyl-ADP-ribose deacetylase (regulator of RNase III)